MNVNEIAIREPLTLFISHSLFPETEAFVTLATNDRYAYGALALGQSLRNSATTRQLAVLVTAQVTQAMR